MFVKELAKKLSKKRNEELNVTMCWLRTKINFLCQRAALLCVRGSRTPWYKENTKAVSEDFRLTVHEADLDLRIADDDNEMKNSRSSDLLPMFYDCKYFS